MKQWVVFLVSSLCVAGILFSMKWAVSDTVSTVPAEASAVPQTVTAEEPSVPVAELRMLHNPIGNDVEAIQIDVENIDVVLVPGEHWGLAQGKPGDEPFIQYKTINHVLNITMPLEKKEHFGPGRQQLVLTVPKNQVLREVVLATTAGDIRVEGISMEKGDFHTAAGSVLAQDTQAGMLALYSFTGCIEAKNLRVESLDMQTKSGDLMASGPIGTIFCETETGNCLIDGDVQGSAAVKTASGNVAVHVVHPCAVDAKTGGNVVYNGESTPFRHFIHRDAPSLEVRSVSGEIRIQDRIISK